MRSKLSPNPLRPGRLRMLVLNMDAPVLSDTDSLVLKFRLNGLATMLLWFTVPPAVGAMPCVADECGVFSSNIARP